MDAPTETRTPLAELARFHGTPLYVYDLRKVAESVRAFDGFDVVRYAIKANSNLAVLSTLRAAGVQCEAVSAGEVERAIAAGFAPDEITYTADLFDRPARSAVARHGLSVNVGSLDMIEAVAEVGGAQGITLRVNPGFGDGHHDRVTTGGPTSKHGIWHTQIAAARDRATAAGLTVEGLHVHIGSGVGTRRLADTVEAMGRVIEVCEESVRRVSTGGGMSVPYRATDAPFDFDEYKRAWFEAREAWSERLGRRLELEVEPGRFLVASSGTLVTEVHGVKQSAPLEDGGQVFVLVDAGFHTLARPVLYGAFHRITALGREDEPGTPKLVAGPLCESTDVLTQGKDAIPEPQNLPELSPGDLLQVHDVGAYGAAMSSCYNSRPLPPEAVIDLEGEAHLIRAALDPSAPSDAERAALAAAATQ